MLLREHIQLAEAILAKAGVDSSGLCARLLVAEVAGLDKIGLITKACEKLEKSREPLLQALVDRRAAGEPLAHILGRKEFYDSSFVVDASTLVPRPETELLVELVLANAPAKNVVCADVCCGCGCVGISLQKERPSWRVILLDNSWGAIGVAAKNAGRLAPAVKVLQGDIFRLPFAVQSLDVLVANPPYIAPEDADMVMPEVLRFEPRTALFSTNHGLAHIEALAGQAKTVLRHGGCLIIEHGAAQRKAVREILLYNGLVDCQDYNDLAGFARCAIAWLR